MTLSRRYHPLLLMRATLLLLMLGIVACATTDEVEVHKSASDTRAYRYLTLDNGLKVLLIEAPSSELSAVSLVVNAGSFQNPEPFPGLAHYLEHMLFLGTEKYPEPNALQKFLEANAGMANAYTANDHTNYFFQIPNEQLSPALDRFSGYFINPLFDREYSGKERTAIHNEWSMGKSQDPRILGQLAGLTANPNHPAARLNVGNRETLPGDEKGSGLYDAMLAFYERYYSANQMSLVMVSQKSLEEQEAMVKEHFSAVPDRKVEPAEVAELGLPEEYQGRHIYYVPQKDMRRLSIEFPLKDNTDQWRKKPNDYVAKILSSEEPGTLGHYLREANLANTMTVQVHPDYYGEDGFLRVNIDATSRGMAERDSIIGATLAYINLVQKQGVAESYYEEYRQLTERQFANQSPPQPLRQALHLAVDLHKIPPAYVNSYYAYYDDFDPEAINAVLNQLQPERMRIWHISMEEPVDTPIPHYDGHYSVLNFAPEELSRWQTLASDFEFELPPANEFANVGASTEVDHSITEMTRVVNQPGVEAWFKHAEHHRDGRALAHFVFNTDIGIANARNFVLGSLVNGLLQESNTSLIDRAGRAGVSISFDRNLSNMQTLSISGEAQTHPELAQQLLNSFATLEFAQPDFERTQEAFREWLSGEASEPPMQQLVRWLERETHAFDWDTQELIELSQEVSPEELRQYHQQLKQTSYLRLYAYGHYSEQQVSELASYGEEALGPEREPGPIVVDPIVVPQNGEDWEINRDVNHSDVGWSKVYVSEDTSIKALAELLLLNSLVNNPFYTQLRTEEQWGYVVGANATRLGDHPALMFLVQSSEKSLPDIAARVERFRVDYADILAEVESNEVDQLRESILAQLTQKPNDFYTEASLYRQDFARNNTQFDTRARLIEALAEVTREDVIERYQELVMAEDPSTITLQAKGANFSDGSFAEE